MIIDPVATHALSKPRRVACVDLQSGRSWTWSAFNSAVNQAANYLVEILGSASGSRVATLARNKVDMLILQFACVRAGAIFVPLNWRLARSEIDALVEDASPSVLFRDRDFEFSAHLGPTSILSEMAAITAGQKLTAPAGARRDWNAASTLLYTSGTSGKPKGVMISEANAFWGSTNFILGNHVSADSVFLCDMPLFHTAGLFANARTPILAGATLLVSPGFDPAATLARLADRALGITHYFSVPQMAQTMWNQPGFSPDMLTGLRVYAMGGAPNPPAQIERFVRAGVAMSDGFGMSETCSNFGMPVGDRSLLIEKAGSCGVPYLSIETRIVDEAGDDVPDGTTGELWLKGPSITRGYWNQPDKTAESFDDGWFKTGDAAIRDGDGFFYLVDRKKDMFISGGENVYPAEVEAVIAQLEVVAECAVIGMADEKWGEVGWVYVIPAPGKSVTPDEVVAHCRSHLAGFKVPKRVIVTDTIPRTASGKVQKHVLKAQALRNLQVDRCQ